VADAVMPPEEPLIVIGAGFTGVAVPLAVRVKVEEDVDDVGEKDAVTPAGRPEAEKVTLPVNPYCGETVMVLDPEAP